MHLFTAHFLNDLFRFTPSCVDARKETPEEYSYAEVRDARSG